MAKKKQLPHYVKMVHDKEKDHVTHLRHIGGGRYYRDAGHWEVGSKRVNGLLISKNIYGKGMSYLSGKRLVRCSATEYYDHNEGHVARAKVGRKKKEVNELAF